MKGPIYYFSRAWHDHNRWNKKAAPLDPQPEIDKPKWRPGAWVLFTDPISLPGAKAVGKVIFVTFDKGKYRYMCEVGHAVYDVPESRVEARMLEG